MIPRLERHQRVYKPPFGSSSAFSFSSPASVRKIRPNLKKTPTSNARLSSYLYILIASKYLHLLNKLNQLSCLSTLVTHLTPSSSQIPSSLALSLQAFTVVPVKASPSEVKERTRVEQSVPSPPTSTSTRPPKSTSSKASFPASPRAISPSSSLTPTLL